MSEAKTQKLRAVGHYVVIRKDGTREPPKPLYAAEVERTPTEQEDKNNVDHDQSRK